MLVVFSKGLHEYFAGIFIAFRFYALTMTISLLSLPSFFLLLFLLRCCTLAGAWKANSDDNARQRAARGRQSRFYATFYDCQQWAETERHPCRIVCPIDISFMWSLWACHLHYFHYILLDNFGVFVCVCVCGNLLLHTYDCVSVPSAFLCLLPSVRGIKNSKS